MDPLLVRSLERSPSHPGRSLPLVMLLEPGQDPAEYVLLVAGLADAVALAGVDHHLGRDLAGQEYLVEQPAQRQRHAAVVAGVQDQGRRPDVGGVGDWA